MKNELKVHPTADLFPMLPDDELQALADDIKQNGLVHPIILDHDGKLLIDGRNRLAACKLAGVEPRFEKLNGHDPLAYIFSTNLNRRDMSKGQKAMIVARARLFATNNTQTQVAAVAGIQQSRIAKAETVIKFAPDLVDGVTAGATSLGRHTKRLVGARAQSAPRTFSWSGCALKRRTWPIWSNRKG
jgi:hypothetical protein